MFALRGITIEEKHWSGTKRAMSTHQETSSNKKAATFVYAHLPSDPVLDDKRFTTSTEHTLGYKGRKLLYCYTEASAISFCSASGDHQQEGAGRDQPTTLARHELKI
jgi:hypothetical protein